MSVETHQMSKTLCKSFKRDRSPCQGQGLEQFDGYCIAHALTDTNRAWRARGGTNSSTAARADKRIPERQQVVIQALTEGMLAVQEGTLSPAACSAICKAGELREYYLLADKEMEAIRAEETQAAAAEIAGAHGDLAILAAADAITAQQNQYRIDALVDQGLATHELARNPNSPPQQVLTDEGRNGLGNRTQSPYTQEDIDELKDAVKS